jgi:hypothetical protein
MQMGGMVGAGLSAMINAKQAYVCARARLGVTGYTGPQHHLRLTASLTTMAVTEIPDSEDEPFTSSPQVASDGAGDGSRGAAALYQASATNASFAATSSDESLNTDRQNAILATASSDHLQSANLQSNMLAQEADGIKSGCSHEHSSAQTSTSLQNTEERTTHDKVGVFERHVFSPMNQQPADCSINPQEVNTADGEDRQQLDDGEHQATIAQKNFNLPEDYSIVSHSHAPEPSYQQISTVKQSIEDDAIDMQPASPPQQQPNCSLEATHNTFLSKGSFDHEHLSMYGAYDDVELSRSPQHSLVRHFIHIHNAF